jgi:hypothetical protein
MDFYKYEIIDNKKTPTIKTASSSPLETLGHEIINIKLENKKYPKGTKVLIFTEDTQIKKSFKNLQYLKIYHNTGQSSFIFVCAFDEKTNSILDRYAIEIESFMDSRPLQIRGPLKIENIIKRKNFYDGLFPKGFREIGGFTFNSLGEPQLNSDNDSSVEAKDFSKNLNLFFPEIVHAAKIFKTGQTLNSFSITLKEGDEIIKAWINGIEVNLETRDYNQRKLVKVRLPFSLEQRRKFFDSKSPSLIFKIQFKNRIQSFWIQWDFINSDYSLNNIEAGPRQSQIEALSEWAIDFDSIQEEELGSIIETYKTAFPDLPIIRILINRYNSYIEKLTGNIEL